MTTLLGETSPAARVVSVALVVIALTGFGYALGTAIRELRAGARPR